MTVGARAALTQFQYTLQDANYDELNVWAPKILAKLQSLPELRDVGTDQQASGTTLQLKIDRDMASRFGIQPQQIDDTLYDAFGQREVTQFFTQINTYYVIEEITPELQKDPKTLDEALHPLAEQRPAGAAQRLRQMDDRAGGAAVDQPSGPIPGGDDQLQPRAGRGARTGDRRDPAGRAGSQTAAGDCRPRSRATRRRSRIR